MLAVNDLESSVVAYPQYITLSGNSLNTVSITALR